MLCSSCAASTSHLLVRAQLHSHTLGQREAIGRARLSRQHSTRIYAGDSGNFLKTFFDFSKWGQTRTAKAWRLGKYDAAEQDMVVEVAGVEELSKAPPVSQSLQTQQVAPTPQSIASLKETQLPASLTQRLAEIGAFVEADDEDEAVPPLTGQELRELIYNKYGKTYDVSFARRDIPGRTLVALNIMWNHLEQRSFQLTEEVYMQKLDSIAYLLNAVQRTQLVRSFLLEPPKSRGGLPKKPVVGCAVSLRLDLDEADIETYFGQGYQ